ncbi:MAG: hypothetical protein CSA95_04490 [Bacteroidetes bacterium]|nr:MAG: hypothetical protein CSA95_04490 [Bacteroidota bacterium]
MKFTIPSLVTGGVIYLLFRTYLDNKQKMALLEHKRETHKELLPVQMQAYERLVLYLERISLNNLVIRVSVPGMNARQLQDAMVAAIRDEFDHNLSQQLYLSDEVWMQVVHAKEELLKIVNQVASTLKEESEAALFAASLFSLSMEQESSPVEMALLSLKKEMRERF